MQLTGRVIIFETDEQAKLWYKSISDVMHEQMIEVAKNEMEKRKNFYKENDDHICTGELPY